MKNLVLRAGAAPAALFIAFAANIDSAKAVALCRCNVQCSGPDGTSFTANDNWGTRPNGNSFDYPFSSNEWNECNSYCSSHVASLDVEGIASAQGVCGAVQCTSHYKLGRRNYRDGDSTEADVSCDGDTGGSEYNQYAARVICGVSDTGNGRPVERGQYKSVVNIHNPNNTPVYFRRKVALGGVAQDGHISQFDTGTTQPDGTQFFQCQYMENLSGVSFPNMIEGFFVIEAQQPLDVSVYYTGRSLTDVNLESLDVEPVEGRSIPGQMCQNRALQSLTNIQSVTIRENTFATQTVLTLNMNDPRLTNELSGALSQTNSDFSGLTGTNNNINWGEYYDVFLSNQDGQANPQGSCVTINGQYDKTAIVGGTNTVGFNIAQVELNFSTGQSIDLDQIGNSSLGDNGVPSTLARAIDGDPTTATQLVDQQTAGGNRNASLTLCSCQ